MDYCIFLLHRYYEELNHTEDRIYVMTQAIQNTITSVFGSSTIKIAGFCTM